MLSVYIPVGLVARVCHLFFSSLHFQSIFLVRTSPWSGGINPPPTPYILVLQVGSALPHRVDFWRTNYLRYCSLNLPNDGNQTLKKPPNASAEVRTFILRSGLVPGVSVSPPRCVFSFPYFLPPTFLGTYPWSQGIHFSFISPGTRFDIWCRGVDQHSHPA